MTRQLHPIIIGLAALMPGLATTTGIAQPAAPKPGGKMGLEPSPDRASDLYRLEKHFDFDERKLGYFEDTPMDWHQLRGDGFPVLYAKGRFDAETGHDAPPSFRLDIATGNVAYEYRHTDLTVAAESDYVIVGYVRTDKLRYAGALVAAYFVDAFGERVPDSQRISKLVRATSDGGQSWQKVRIDLPGEFPSAHALRLQFWILQDYVWSESDPHEIDPIARRDVYGTAWFDDFSVYRLPRVELRLSNAAGLVQPGRSEEIVLEVTNASAQQLEAELCLTDRAGRLCHRQKVDVPATDWPIDPLAGASSGSGAGQSPTPFRSARIATIRMPIPSLPPGSYTAQLRLLGGTTMILERNTQFAVLPELPPAGTGNLDLGVDLGRWSRADNAGLLELLETLGCGAVKIGIPMIGELAGEEADYFQDLGTLLNTLAENGIDAIGVMLSPSAATDPIGGDSTRRLVTRDDVWQNLFSPILTYFGASLPTWQLGAEAIELRNAGRWQSSDVERVRAVLRRFITIPRLAIPQPLTAVSPPGGDIASVWIPAEVPTRTLPHQLEFLTHDDAPSYWLQLADDERRQLTPADRVNDLAQRLVLAKALNPGRVFVPAPFELSHSGGHTNWQPTEHYPILRTLFHHLSGKTAAAAMVPAPDTLAVIFRNGASSCTVIWSWRDGGAAEPVELYLGPNPRAADLWGRSVPLEVVDGRTRLPVGATPIIVEQLHTPLALLQASYDVVPTRIQVHDPEPRPVLTFCNTFDTRLAGEVRLSAPEKWKVVPDQRSFVLEPGETFCQPLTLILPPRQIAQSYDLGVQLHLRSPERAELSFVEPLVVELRDIVVNAAVYWESDALIVEQSLRNLSRRAVSFDTYCDAPARARQEGQFLEVRPGELAIQRYTFPNSRELHGARLSLGIDEIGGQRTLIQFADAPD